MGYFSNALVFTSQPDFDQASLVAPGRSARGYKHKTSSLWLLDLWKPRGKLQLRQAPFCDPAADGFRTDLAEIDTATRLFLTTLEELLEATGFGINAPQVANLHFSLAVATAVRGPVYFFAADDNELDMGCNAAPNSIVTFGARLDRLSVQYVNAETTIVPLRYSGYTESDEEALSEVVDATAAIPGIALTQPREVGDGQILYENPVGHWPKTAGDPAQILGLGTWDPWENLDRDFDVVFEKLTA